MAIEMNMYRFNQGGAQCPSHDIRVYPNMFTKSPSFIRLGLLYDAGNDLTGNSKQSYCCLFMFLAHGFAQGNARK